MPDVDLTQVKLFQYVIKVEDLVLAAELCMPVSAYFQYRSLAQEKS